MTPGPHSNTTRRPTRRVTPLAGLAWLAGVAVSAVLFAGCGISVDDAPRDIDLQTNTTNAAG